MRISASFHHHSRPDNPSSDTARVTIKKISVNARLHAVFIRGPAGINLEIACPGR